jgi:hypothetical protein
MSIRKLIISALLMVSASAGAQCTFHNDAFKSGEFLSYNLYYNWKFVWVKAGYASMYTVQSVYNGRSAYRASLTTRGNNRVDDFFVLRDTLLCYSSLDMAPLYYRKGAREGKRYTVDEINYSYPNGDCHVRQHRLHHDGRNTTEQHTYQDCIYDMMNMFLRARSFNPDGWKNGHDVDFSIADGDKRTPAKLRYHGKTTIKADNGRKYRCLQLSYLELDDGKFKEIVRFFVTDDRNHIPIRLDMFLRFGSAKAFLVNMKGIRNPIDSIAR